MNKSEYLAKISSRAIKIFSIKVINCGKLNCTQFNFLLSLCYE